MAIRYEINHEGKIVIGESALCADQSKMLQCLFSQYGWNCSEVNKEGSCHILELSHPSYNTRTINVYSGSIRNESRNAYEKKIQLGPSANPKSKPKDKTIILGIYVYQAADNCNDAIFVGYPIDESIRYETNPSIRGTFVNKLLIQAKTQGFVYDREHNSVGFRSEFAYYYLTNYYKIHYENKPIPDMSNNFKDRDKNKLFSVKDLPEAFDSKFARRYITSLMAKPFVILTGNSGTGKTRISKQFAEYLEVVDDEGEKNWLIVPVGADWTDNTKVMGFYNPLAESENEDGSTGRYEKTGILKLIERANDNPSIPYFLVLDEMNLSHVERYFSDFLSHMETPDIPFKIDGYDNELGEGDKEELRYPENLFVVGTVNIDETTYMFSPKILDRANVVEFKPDRDDVLARFDSTEPEEKITPAGKGVAIDFLRIAMDIRDEVETLDKDDVEEVKRVFSEIYEICKEQGYEFAYRTVAEVKKYITAAAELSDDWYEDELTSAIDEQVLQKVLPKIHGSRKEIGDMLEKLETFCDDNTLKLSKEKIEQMIKRLDAVQYASFI